MRRWLFRTATNLSLDHFRETKRERARADVVTRETPVVHEPREALRHDMMRTFSELKPRERALLWLAYVEEDTHADIAASLRLGRASVKVMLSRARGRLRDLLKGRGFTQGSGT